jgi:hypothetical protein
MIGNRPTPARVDDEHLAPVDAVWIRDAVPTHYLSNGHAIVRRDLCQIFAAHDAVVDRRAACRRNIGSQCSRDEEHSHEEDEEREGY